MIDPGKLNRRISIQKKTGTFDGYGQVDLVWVDVAQVWANIKPITARSKLRMKAVESSLTSTVAIRYDRNLLPVNIADDWRIVYDGRIMKINAAQDLDDARRFIIYEVVEAG
jgi:SPP1 family predicted phage head-tail adaptor